MQPPLGEFVIMCLSYLWHRVLHFGTFLSLSPSSLCDIFAHACSALRRKDWASAVSHYEVALAINPLNPDAWFALGYAHLKLVGHEHQALRVSVLSPPKHHGQHPRRFDCISRDYLSASISALLLVHLTTIGIFRG